MLCDYGSCTVRPMHPETMGAAQCEDEISRFTTLAYRSPEMVSLYSGKTVSTKADIWVCMLDHTFTSYFVLCTKVALYPAGSQCGSGKESLVCLHKSGNPNIIFTAEFVV